MPRPAKPPAQPIEMPRTEHDLDQLLRAIEIHAGIGHQIGSKISDGSMTASAALDRAAAADQRLYDTADKIMQERESERQADIDSEQSGTGS